MLINILFSVLGLLVYLFFLLKKEGDKFEDKDEDFDYKKYLNKNKFDLPFLLVSSIVILELKELIFYFIDVSESVISNLSDRGLSILSGAIGPLILEGILNKTNKK